METIIQDSIEVSTILKNFINYYEYKITTLDTKYIPLELFNKFHKFNDYFDKFRTNRITLYSGSELYRNMDIIHDWTTDIDTAEAFAKNNGFVVSIDKIGFTKRFNFISMDILYDYLVCNISDEDNRKILNNYVSESEVYAIELK